MIGNDDALNRSQIHVNSSHASNVAKKPAENPSNVFATDLLTGWTSEYTRPWWSLHTVDTKWLRAMVEIIWSPNKKYAFFDSELLRSFVPRCIVSCKGRGVTVQIIVSFGSNCSTVVSVLESIASVLIRPLSHEKPLPLRNVNLERIEMILKSSIYVWDKKSASDPHTAKITRIIGRGSRGQWLHHVDVDRSWFLYFFEPLLKLIEQISLTMVPL